MLTGRFEHAEAARRASPSVQRFSKDLLGHTARLRNGSCIRRYVRLLVPCRVEPDRKRRSHHQYLVGSAQISDFLPKTLRLSHCVLGRPSRLLRDCRLRLVGQYRRILIFGFFATAQRSRSFPRNTRNVLCQQPGGFRLELARVPSALCPGFFIFHRVRGKAEH